METQILLANLRSLLERVPDFASYSPSSSEHQVWLGQAHALIARWSQTEAFSFKLASNSLASEFFRLNSVAQLLAIIYRAIADLELSLPTNTAQQVFGPGASYDFFKALNTVIDSAQRSLFIADPYIDDTIFDCYLSSLQPGIKVRLLAYQYTAKLKPAAERFIAQHGASIEIRCSSLFHDRLVFVDDSAAWVLGSSIKDAAAAKPTYLAPLAPDIAALKLPVYEGIWTNASAI